MPRKARHCPPETLQHVISRFVDRGFRLVDDDDRRTYLSFAAAVAPRVDWRFLAYALMSNHPHWALLSGCRPLGAIFHPVHTRFARYWHRRYGGLGPVFANRPDNHHVRSSRFAQLVAYVHMNPVRAGMVDCPAESRWTSHRLYLRLDPVPAWLDVRLGLQLCGFDDDEADRRRFDEFVRSQHRLHWQQDLTDSFDCSPQPELACPTRQPPLADCDVARIVDAACRVTGVGPAAVRSTSRVSEVCATRRLVANIAHNHAGATLADIAREIGSSSQGIRKMLERGTDESTVNAALQLLMASRAGISWVS